MYYLCMYVSCMSVYLFVCMYVCTFVCTFVCMSVCLYVWHSTDGFTSLFLITPVFQIVSEIHFNITSNTDKIQGNHFHNHFPTLSFTRSFPFPLSFPIFLPIPFLNFSFCPNSVSEQNWEHAGSLQKRRFHREGYRLHPFSSSCFISSKTTFSPRRLPAPPLFVLLFHIFKNDIFTERVTGSTPFHPLVSYLPKRRFHREGYRLLLFHIFKKGIFTERVTGSTSFHPLVSHLQKRHFHREGYRLHPFSSSCFISSIRTFSRRGLPAPPFFILLFHTFKNGMFTARVTGSTPFHPLVSYLQKRHVLREGYRLHPFSSSCFKSSKTTFSPRRFPAPPLFILLLHSFKNGVFTERVTGSTPFYRHVSYLQKRRFLRKGYWHHLFSSSCFISSKTALSPRGLPAPPLFILLFHIFKNDIFTERVASPTPFHPLVSYLQKRDVHGSTPFHPLVSYLQKQHFHREGYWLHTFSSSCFISSKMTFSPRGSPAPPLFILLFHIFKNGIFTESYRLHPFSSSCFISSKTAFSHGEGYRLHPFFILLFHIFKNDIFTERVTGSTPFHPLVSYLQKRHFTERVTGSTPFSSSCFISSKRTFSPRRLPAPHLFILLFHIFKNEIFPESGREGFFQEKRCH